MSTTNWSAGYMSDIAYTFGYYNELNPLRAKLAFANAGVAYPDVRVACELGFGQGVSANIHAAASPIDWWGTDFNPSQAGFAQEMAAASGAKAHFFDQTFAEFAMRADMPDFDYIGLHGIWSWISEENSSVIVDFVRRKLKVGGVLYISYNSMPGWAAFAPMRDLLMEHAEIMAVPGRGILSRVDAALEFAAKLVALNPAYARANPQIGERIQAIKGQNRHYVAHEYFNREWRPMSFAKLAEWFAPAKVSYVCAAHYLDDIDAINLNADQQAFLKEIPDSMFRATVRDFMVNLQFRRDYWVKGARALAPTERADALRAQSIILTSDRADVSMTTKGALGDALMHEAIYSPILDAVSDHRPKTLAHLDKAVSAKGVTFAQMVEAVMVLIGNGHVHPVQDEALAAASKGHIDKLNAYLMNKARGNNDLGFLASPVTGGGVSLPRLSQLFLLAEQRGKKRPADWAEFVWGVLSEQGQRLLKDGKALDSPEENLAELKSMATVFGEKQLPTLRALGIS